MFGFGKKKIRVEFFRSGETNPFVVSDMPVDQLPDTFVVDTTLHINDEDWRVLAAQPVDKAAFRKTGKLQLTLTNTAPMALDAESILFSIATISDDFPSLVPVESMEDVAVFHEDDWRQVEFISISYEALIAEEMNAIDAVVTEAGDVPGFRHMHIRRRIPEPFREVSVTVDDLKRHFGVRTEFAGVGFNIAPALLEGGFAFKTLTGTVLWGQAGEDSRVRFLNLLPPSMDGLGDTDVLDDFLSDNDLYLVRWEALEMRGCDDLPARPLTYNVTLARAQEDLRLKTDFLQQTFGLGSGGSWNADLEAGIITFDLPDGVHLSAPVQVIGTLDTRDGTWMWGWDHPSVPSGLDIHARAVLDFGRKQGVERLTTHVIAADEGDAWDFAALAMHLTNAQGVYCGPAGTTLVMMTLGDITASKPTGSTRLH